MNTKEIVLLVMNGTLFYYKTEFFNETKRGKAAELDRMES
jgi:hypothetical protein